MRSKVRILGGLVGAVVLMLTVPGMVHALSWQVNDSLSISVVSETEVYSGLGGYGGLFRIYNQRTQETLFTFCVELDEFTTYAKYVEDISDDIAMAGGRNTDHGDQLGGPTKWLFSRYLAGDPNYSDPRALQLAIWYLEEEYVNISGVTTLEQWKAWYAHETGEIELAERAVSYIEAAIQYPNFSAPYIRVLDTDDAWNGRGNWGQSYIFVPEPATVGMLGLGLIGFAVAARRLRRRG
ncbi:MAG: PEP-CTERM sorting domain-containing protein [Candidatus Methanosuratincola sp.]